MTRKEIVPVGSSAQQLVGRHVQESKDALCRWLAASLGADEPVLAWLGVTKVMLPARSSAPAGRARWRYLMTDQRSSLVAFQSRRRVHEIELPRRALHVAVRMGRGSIQVAGFRFKSWLNNDELFREIGPIAGLSGEDRVREIARLEWVNDTDDSVARVRAHDLLERLAAARGRPLDRLTALVVGGGIDPGQDPSPADAPVDDADRGVQQSDPLGRCLQELVGSEVEPSRLGTWGRRWNVTAADKRVIVRRMRRLCPSRRAGQLSLPLHRQLRDEQVGQKRRPEQAAASDTAFAQHLHEAGQAAEAIRVLEERLAALPAPSLDDLSADGDGRGLLVGGELASTRRDLLEALAEVHDPATPEHTARALELAQLEPVRPSRMDELIERSSGLVAARAKRLRELLDAGALEPQPSAAGAADIRPIPRGTVESRLPHPAARDAGAAARMQQWLGRAQQPDYATIKSYSERATQRDQPMLLDALSDATLALGVDAVEAFVSRGDRRMGIRAYDATPPFLVVGGDHLDRSSEVYLGEGALRFAVGAEVAHLRFEHTRLTSSELWDGVIHRGKQVLDVAAMLAGPLGALGNLLRGAQQATKVERALRYVGAASRKVANVLGVAKEIQTVIGDGTAEPEGSDQIGVASHGELLAACRAMQLTADRAGLVLAGDLGAAIRALYLSSRAYRAELRMAERHGLAKTLARQDAAGEPPHRSLTLRIAALCSFYLSDDYVELRAALLVDDADELSA